MEETTNVLDVLSIGDVILFNERGLKHIPSRILVRTPWHHVMLYAGEGKAIDVIPTSGCYVTHLDITKKRYLSYKVLRYNTLSEVEKEKIILAAQVFLGKGFSWLQVFRGLARKFLPKHAKSRVIIAERGVNVQSLICTNFVALVYSAGGISILQGYPPEYAMPKDYLAPEGFTCILEKNLEYA